MIHRNPQRGSADSGRSPYGTSQRPIFAAGFAGETASHREASRASGCWSMSTAKEPASIGSANVSPTGEFVTSLPKPGHFTTATCDDAIWRRCLVNDRLCDILHIGLCSIAANHICLADTVLVGQHDVALATSTFR